ncbi:MAG: UMP kinase [Clostridiales bacterium]|nr:UMP kinase [Clostridiales bacterium]
MKPKYKKVILKISGEALAGEGRFGLDEKTLGIVAQEVREVVELGVQTGVVVGGGNFWRGRTSENMDRATADYMGMLATVINALALQSAFEDAGLSTRVQTAIEMREIAEPYIRRKAIAEMDRGDIVIFAAGTGNPFFSTDTTAALRAAEIEADVILLAKRIDAVYSDDPEKNPDAVRYTKITHQEILEKGLKVMDSTAASLCRDNGIPVHVFALGEKGNVLKAVLGGEIGTLIT